MYHLGGRTFLGLSVLTFLGLSMMAGPIYATPPESPAISTYAPAEDLVAQFDYYLERLQSAVATEAEYKDVTDRVVKDASTIVLIALGLGLHDSPNKYKAQAPAMVAAARKLVAATDYASTKAAVDALASAAKGSGASGSLKWDKVASLKALMEQVPLINSRIKRYMRRFERESATIAGDAAAIAIISQGSLYNVDETEKADEVQKWYDACIQMRDAAAALNKAARAKDLNAANEALKALAKSCDDCHIVFHPEALGKEL